MASTSGVDGNDLRSEEEHWYEYWYDDFVSASGHWLAWYVVRRRFRLERQVTAETFEVSLTAGVGSMGSMY